jgi:hypothetical protein
MNSYSTQVEQLQFEYIYELEKICLDMTLDLSDLKMILRNEYDHRNHYD